MEVYVMPKKNPENEARRQRRKELTGFLNSVGVTDVGGVRTLKSGLCYVRWTADENSAVFSFIVCRLRYDKINKPV